LDVGREDVNPGIAVVLTTVGILAADIATKGGARLWRGLSLLALRAAHPTIVLTRMQRASRRSGACW
jgi:hypothetical protein